MNLKEACDARVTFSIKQDFSEGLVTVSSEVYTTLHAAAKKQLAEEEEPLYPWSMGRTKLLYKDCNGAVLMVPVDWDQARWLPAQKALIDACKAAGEEAKKPKRASLDDLEVWARNLAIAHTVHGSPKNGQVADILKALRETVVPWLKKHSTLNFEHDTHDMLRALGEEP